MTQRLTILCAALVLLMVMGASPADAHRKSKKVRTYSRPHTFGESYSALKVGGYDLDGIEVGNDDFDGLFLGAEWGTSPSPYVDLGLSVDWLRRRQGNSRRLVIDTPYELPVANVVELQGTSTDLVPLAVGTRLKMPLGNGVWWPFVSGQLSFDILHLSYHELQDDQGIRTVEEDSETFFGFGSTVGLGVEAHLDRSFALMAEVGVHNSRPSRDLEIDGIPVRGEVDAGGGFARIGMRFSLH